MLLTGFRRNRRSNGLLSALNVVDGIFSAAPFGTVSGYYMENECMMQSYSRYMLMVIKCLFLHKVSVPFAVLHIYGFYMFQPWYTFKMTPRDLLCHNSLHCSMFSLNTRHIDCLKANELGLARMYWKLNDLHTKLLEKSRYMYSICVSISLSDIGEM